MFEYKLKPSLMLLRFNLGIYCLSLLVLLSYGSKDYLSLLLFFLIVSAVIYEWKTYRQAKVASAELLLLNTAEGTVEWRNNSKKRQFTAYSVYTCRWVMILVCKESWTRSSFILLADRFDNKRQYLDLRFHLIHSNQAMHAS